jgi:hypothetical protein
MIGVGWWEKVGLTFYRGAGVRLLVYALIGLDQVHKVCGGREGVKVGSTTQ